jgi:hypothetical protein
MVVWAVHTIVFWPWLSWALGRGLLGKSPGLIRLGRNTLGYTWLPIVVTFAVITVSIRVQFPLLFPF